MRKLRVQVREDASRPGPDQPRVRVEVLAPDGTVLGDLANVVTYDGIVYHFNAHGPSVLTISFAVERASIDALELAGYNVTKTTRTEPARS